MMVYQFSVVQKICVVYVWSYTIFVQRFFLSNTKTFSAEDDENMIVKRFAA